MSMRLVVIESPFRGASPAEEARNIAYLHRAMRDSLGRGEAPFASHELYTRALRDSDPRERELGIEAGIAWGCYAQAVIVYLDLGVSPGMLYGIRSAIARGVVGEARWMDRGKPGSGVGTMSISALGGRSEAVLPWLEADALAGEHPYVGLIAATTPPRA